MHPLLQRQLRHHLINAADLSEPCRKFLAAVDEAYRQADDDRKMIERSLEKMSQELLERNRDLRRQLDERHQVEQALRQSEARLAHARQAARMGGVEWDIPDDTFHFSEEALRILGLSARDTHMNLKETIGLIVPDGRERARTEVEACLRDHTPYSLEHEISLPDGSIRHVLVQGDVVLDASGKPGKMVGTVHDITERKQAERELQKEKEEQSVLIQKLEEAHNQLLQSEKLASIGQLAAGVAHEINNPIGYVSSNLGSLHHYVEQLLRVLAAYEQADAFLAGQPALYEPIRAIREEAEIDYLKQDILALLDESREGAERVRRIVQDLKDFSHTDQGELALADLHKGLDTTLNVAHNEIKYKAQVIKEYGDIPPVLCHASQINQVFLNLLVNAAHAIKDKGVITVRTRAVGEEVWVEVSDTGCGIPPENLTRIFEPFFTTKPVGKGTGLGLALSWGIVNKHGGKIEVKSVAGQGSTFRVRLPVNSPAEPTAGRHQQADHR